MAPDDPPPFIHSVVQTETRLLIKATCTKCGVAKIVSVHDDSLYEWEYEHQSEHTDQYGDIPRQP